MTPDIAMTPYMMESLVLWGLVATTAMAAILQLSQGLGLSRMSLTFLMGSAFSGDRSVATVLGFVLYIIGGWLFAFLLSLIHIYAQGRRTAGKLAVGLPRSGDRSFCGGGSDAGPETFARQSENGRWEAVTKRFSVKAPTRKCWN